MSRTWRSCWRRPSLQRRQRCWWRRRPREMQRARRQQGQQQREQGQEQQRLIEHETTVRPDCASRSGEQDQESRLTGVSSGGLALGLLGGAVVKLDRGILQIGRVFALVSLDITRSDERILYVLERRVALDIEASASGGDGRRSDTSEVSGERLQVSADGSGHDRIGDDSSVLARLGLLAALGLLATLGDSSSS
jgi:hypothetical protein